VFLVARAGALHKQDAADRLPVRGTAHGSLGHHPLQLHIGDDIRNAAIAQMPEFRGIVRAPAVARINAPARSVEAVPLLCTVTSNIPGWPSIFRIRADVSTWING